MFVSAPFPLTTPTPGPARRACLASTWEHPAHSLGGASPTLMANDRLSSAGTLDDIIFLMSSNVIIFVAPLPPPLCQGAEKTRSIGLNVAQLVRGSVRV